MKLAIIVEGDQNSGKTTTIKELINLRSWKNLKQVRRGWQSISLNLQFPDLKLNTYCIPASPSESNYPLDRRFQGWCPNVLIIAEQPGGQHYTNTHNFLTSNNYTIYTFSIMNTHGPLDWERFDTHTKSQKLGNRVNDIIHAMINHINTNKII